MAVGLERAHAERVGQGQGLLVVGFSLVDVMGSAMPDNIAQEPQDPRLVAPFLVGTSELESLLGERYRLIHAASQEIGFAQPGVPALSSRHGGLLHHLL